MLVATHPGSTPASGYADIGLSTLTPQRYATGALLVNGTRLVAILQDYVILERDGKQERIYPVGAIGRSTDKVTLARVGGAQLPPAKANSSEALTEVLRVNPIFKDDKVVALEVGPGAHASVLGEIGLTEGDRIIAVQGHSVENMDVAISALRGLGEGRSVSVSIVRNGSAQVVRLTGVQSMPQ
jgi:type II secretion system protein C